VNCVRHDALRKALGARALFIMGDPGMGKTSVLLAAGKLHDGPVLRVACQRIAQEAQLEPILALLRLARRVRGDGRLHNNVAERERILELRVALEVLTQNEQPLVQIDDFQWGDDSTREAVPYLIERLADYPICWHVAARTGYQSVNSAVHRLKVSGLAEDLTLQPLGESDILKIVDQCEPSLDRRARNAVVARAAGNPLYAQLLTRSSAAGAFDIASLARDHVSDLPQGVLTIAAALAIIDKPLDLYAICEITHQSLTGVQEACALLSARGLAQWHDAGIMIRHHVLAEAIVRECDSVDLEKIHASAADFVEEGERRAQHLIAAKRYNEARQLLAQLGWRNLENEEWASAARCFANAIAIESHGSQPLLMQPQSLLAALRLLRRIITDKSAPYDEVDGWMTLGDEVQARLELARIRGFLLSSSNLDSGHRARLTSLADADVKPAIAAELLYEVIRASHRQLDDDGAKVALRRLQSLTPAITSTLDRCKSEARIALYAAVYDDWDAGISAYGESIQQAATLKAQDIVLRVVQDSLSVFSQMRRSEEGLRWGKFARELKRGSPLRRALLDRSYCMLLSVAGRYQEAMSIITDASKTLLSLPSKSEHEATFAQQILLATELGLIKRARGLISECEAMGASGGMAKLIIGYFYEQHGDQEKARAALDADFESPLRALPFNVAAACLALARIALRTSDERLMERTLRRLRRFAGKGIVQDAWVKWGEGYGLLLCGRSQEALTLFEQARQAPLAVMGRLRIQYEIARITRRSGDFIEVIDGFRALGADFMAERAIAAARQMNLILGGRYLPTRKATSFTDHQRAIALMVSEGKTNAEIAGALSISKRTAEHHVDQIRNKLGVRSRVEIAMAVASGEAFR
jgi:DNA-binding CsgD family transcriptional regulator